MVRTQREILEKLRARFGPEGGPTTAAEGLIDGCLVVMSFAGAVIVCFVQALSRAIEAFGQFWNQQTEVQPAT
ncbi:MAG: hypothetical protein ABFE07_29615 [Armatimonadia bacterium]